MKKLSIIFFLVFIGEFVVSSGAFSQGQLDPIRLNSMSINVGMGIGTPYFGNGLGFGPAVKGSFEKGMFDLGPGVITLGGEFTMSVFSHDYGNDRHESWANFFFAGRGAYHYGWDIEGFDTYAGMPVGIGFCAHSSGDFEGSRGAQAVFPYVGFFVGANYFFNKNFGINGELGFNSTYSNIGVIYKL
jgi:hypothetical protein